MTRRRIAWTPEMDAAIRQAIDAGRPTSPLADRWGFAEWTVRDRARRLGIIPTGGVPRTREEAVFVERMEDRAPLPAGHPIPWQAITAGTSIEGAPYG